MEFTFKDYLRMPAMVTIAEFADKAEKAIMENYSTSFGINNNEISVYSNSHCGEYYCNATLTSQGLWKFNDNWWGGRNYEILCTGEEIFKHFVNQMKMKENKESDNAMDCALREFKSWVKSLPTWKDEKDSE